MPSLTPSLERALERSLALAAERGHERATPEHLLLALLSDSDARELLKDANLTSLEAALGRALDGQPRCDDVGLEKVHPTAVFQRIIQRAVLRCESAGPPVVTGADIVLAMLSEKETEAARLLEAEGIALEAGLEYLQGKSSGASAWVSQPAGPADSLEPVEMLRRQLAIAMYRIERLEEQVRDLLRK